MQNLKMAPSTHSEAGSGSKTFIAVLVVLGALVGKVSHSICKGQVRGLNLAVHIHGTHMSNSTSTRAMVSLFHFMAVNISLIMIFSSLGTLALHIYGSSELSSQVNGSSTLTRYTSNMVPSSGCLPLKLVSLTLTPFEKSTRLAPST